MSASSTFMRDFLDPVFKADQLPENVEDIGTAAKNATDIIWDLRAVFECIGKTQSRIETRQENAILWSNNLKFLVGPARRKGSDQRTHKTQKFPKKLRFPKSKIFTVLPEFHKLLQKLLSWDG